MYNLIVIHPYAKIRYAYVKEQLRSYKTRIHGENIILILRLKVKVIQTSWMYATHRTMVIHVHSRVKHSMTISQDKKNVARTQSHVINPINLTLRSNLNVISGSWMYATHLLMLIDPCAKYGMPISKQTGYGSDTKTQQKSINLT